MAQTCKVCMSDKKDEIERMIKLGYSNNAIANKMQAIGIMVTHASINRHKAKHMKNDKELIEQLATPKHNVKLDNRVETIDMETIIDNAKEQAKKQVSQKELKENYRVTHILLTKITMNQLAITLDLQEKFINGMTKYPQEQIRGLQIIHDLSAKINNEFSLSNDMTLTEMANEIIRKSIHGVIKPDHATVLMTLLEKIGKIKVNDELESRIEKLESQYES